MLTLSLLAGEASRAEDPKAKPVSEADIVKLIDLGVEEDAIIARINKGGVAFKPTEEVLARLKKAGASERVLRFLQGDKPLATAKHRTGVVLEVTDIKRTEDGLMQISWRYRNPKDQKVKVFSRITPGSSFSQADDVAYKTLERLYYTYQVSGRAFRSDIAKDTGGKVWCSSVREGIELKPKETSQVLWGKFHIPQGGQEDRSHLQRR
jgi:hypothetical protein